MSTAEDGGYLARIRAYPSLPREREVALARRWRRKRDKAAADELIRASLKQVVPIAMRFRISGEPIDDLVAEGSLGLLHALEKFDPERGNRFQTYARYWIQAYLIRYVRRTRSIVSTPIHEDATLYAQIVRLRRTLGSAAAADEGKRDEMVADKLGVSVEKVREVVQRFGARDMPMDTPALELTSRSPDPARLTEQKEIRELLLNALEAADLDHRERYIVEQRLLADPGSEPSLAAMGRRIGITREWARRLERRGLAKLQPHLSALREARNI